MRPLERGPVVRSYALVAVAAEADDLVARPHIVDVRDVNRGVVHRNAPDHLAPHALYQHRAAVGKCEREPVGVACAYGRHAGRRIEAPRPPVAKRRARRQRADLRHARLERQDRFELQRAQSVGVETAVEIDARPHCRKRRTRGLGEIVYRVGCRHVDAAERNPRRLQAVC